MLKQVTGHPVYCPHGALSFGSHQYLFLLQSEYADPSTPAVTLAEFRSHDASAIANDLADALRRERKLKARVQELVTTLEKLSRNAEIRHQQSAEFVSDLKRANR